MSNNQNRQSKDAKTNSDYKFLYDQNESEKIKHVVKRVKKSYEKFYSGEIDEKTLQSEILKENNLQKTDKIERVFSQNSPKFTTIVKSLNILKHNDKPEGTLSPERLKESVGLRFPRYKRKSETPTKSLVKDNNVEHAVKNFISRGGNEQLFKLKLSKNNINPDVPQINKMIHNYKSGFLTFQDAMNTINQTRANKIEQNRPTEIVNAFKTSSNYTHLNKTPSSRKLCHGVSNPNLCSHKELFDWDSKKAENVLNQYGMPPSPMKKNGTRPISYKLSDIEKGSEEKVPSKAGKSSTKSTALYSTKYSNNGDIFTWDQFDDTNKAKSRKKLIEDPVVLNPSKSTSKITCKKNFFKL